jgi:hypothetical protein
VNTGKALIYKQYGVKSSPLKISQRVGTCMEARINYENGLLSY